MGDRENPQSAIRNPQSSRVWVSVVAVAMAAIVIFSGARADCGLRIADCGFETSDSASRALILDCECAGTDAPFNPQSAIRNPQSKADAKTGKRLYTNYGCYQCHGYEGQGAPTTGPRLAPDPIPFAAFVGYLRGPRGEMPPYTAKVVSDQELADIYAFLQSLPHPPAARSLPLLKIE